MNISLSVQEPEAQTGLGVQCVFKYPARDYNTAAFSIDSCWVTSEDTDHLGLTVCHSIDCEARATEQ